MVDNPRPLSIELNSHPRVESEEEHPTKTSTCGTRTRAHRRPNNQFGPPSPHASLFQCNYISLRLDVWRALELTLIFGIILSSICRVILGLGLVLTTRNSPV